MLFYGNLTQMFHITEIIMEKCFIINIIPMAFPVEFVEFTLTLSFHYNILGYLGWSSILYLECRPRNIQAEIPTV